MAANPSAGATTVARALLEAYNRGAVDDAIALYAPDGVHEDVAQQSRKQGPDAIARGLGGLLRAVPDARWRVDVLAGDETTAAVAYVMEGTLQDRLGPFEPRGQAISLEGLLLISVEQARSAARATTGTAARSAASWREATPRPDQRGDDRGGGRGRRAAREPRDRRVRRAQRGAMRSISARAAAVTRARS
jgi:predicted ester cyclase